MATIYHADGRQLPEPPAGASGPFSQAEFPTCPDPSTALVPVRLGYCYLTASTFTFIDLDGVSPYHQHIGAKFPPPMIGYSFRQTVRGAINGFQILTAVVLLSAAPVRANTYLFSFTGGQLLAALSAPSASGANETKSA